MPLFSRKDKRHDAHRTDRDHKVVDNQQNFNIAGPGPHNGSPGVTDNVPGHGARNNAAGIGSNASGPGSNVGYDSRLQQGATQPGYGNSQTSDPYSGGNTTGNNGPNVVPTNHFNAQPGQNTGSGSRMTGKMEHAVGSLVGSQALKAKGMQKEQEAQAFQAQSTEIAEAERLEKEAILRRERAVQHGAHPSNKPLGGVQNQQVGQNTQGFGGGGAY